MRVSAREEFGRRQQCLSIFQMHGKAEEGILKEEGAEVRVA
jgi:hypothetical protein